MLFFRRCSSVWIKLGGFQKFSPLGNFTFVKTIPTYLASSTFPVDQVDTHKIKRVVERPRSGKGYPCHMSFLQKPNYVLEGPWFCKAALHVPTLFRRLENRSKFAGARATYYFHQCLYQLVYLIPYMGRALVNCILASSVLKHFLCIENREVRNLFSTVHSVLNMHYQTTRHI